MKTNVLVFVLAPLVTNAFSQQAADDSYITRDKNHAWLTKLKDANDSLKLNLIIERFLVEPAKDQSPDMEVPVLIIDGIVFSEGLENTRRKFFRSEITVEKISISVLDTAPVAFCTPFTGIIIISITDEETSKDFSKIN